MPLYDYECHDCGERFELLILRNSPTAACPSCQSQNLEQLISLFAVDSESTRQASLAIARQKNSKIARDKRIADDEVARNHHD